MSLDGKIIVVVGAAGLLGKIIALHILEEGASLIAVDVSGAALEEAFSNVPQERISLSEVDITNKCSVENILSKGHVRFGRIDGAVNAAYPRNKNYGRKFFDVTYEDFCENVSLHLGGYFLFMQQCARYSTENNKPFSLVNISSIYGVIAPRFDIYDGTGMTMPVEYAAIKSALLHLNKYLTSYLKGSSFRVNSVSPGGILAGQNSDFIEKYNAHSRSKGMLSGLDVVGSVCFLLSDSSCFVCGQNIVVDDAFTA